ncbi:MAG: rod shape-determining protein MreC [Chitinophagales bacterium]|nr:rod shape-determining protein MreC [Bacteroidota bacterium]HPE96613.1 rod shape-determining protein MreC [Chitinophagales bacterium]HPR28243.1 rod shape-determining protein MreC [Chitinophagales bacterium]HQU76535.1 rod shape-determining protein MreC [Chitinophagales bacterium]HRX22886.1 rod shape-determining protein MreC [Chitinophagales bacterium]
MRSFIQFLLRYHVFFLFLLLELISLWFLFSNNAYQRTFFVHSANRMTGNVLNTYGNLTKFFYLSEVNDSLLAENALLREAMMQQATADSGGRISMLDEHGEMLYSCMPAKVINNTFTLPNNYITLDKGSEDGIVKDMGVITSNGLVGIVKDVSPHFSVVLSVLHSHFHTRVAVKKNNVQGRLVWNGEDPTVVKIVDVSEPGHLEPGDTIVTTGYSAAFPPGYPVGVLKSYGKETGSNFYTLEVELTTAFSRLHYVYVVDYLLKEEQTNLEEESHAGN